MLFEQVGIYLPFYDIFRNKLEEFTAQHTPSLTPYAPLLAGSLARSLACTSCYPIELAKTRMQVFHSSYCQGLIYPPYIKERKRAGLVYKSFLFLVSLRCILCYICVILGIPVALYLLRTWVIHSFNCSDSLFHWVAPVYRHLRIWTRSLLESGRLCLRLLPMSGAQLVPTLAVSQFFFLFLLSSYRKEFVELVC